MERPLSADRFGLQRAAPRDGARRPEDVEKQPATEFRVLQDNADKFQHNKDLTERRVKAVEDAGAFRAPTNAARSFNPQFGDVQQLGAVGSMTVRSTEGRVARDSVPVSSSSIKGVVHMQELSVLPGSDGESRVPELRLGQAV